MRVVSKPTTVIGSINFTVTDKQTSKKDRMEEKDEGCFSKGKDYSANDSLKIENVKLIGTVS